ncbi:hypothetical protein HDV06_005780 [Boothiomyces sp. JEL0866]|nr:hypothetical protein HDV06_005780 [Boothiomyces sp. JEL0866]
MQMKNEREQLKLKYIREGKMADPDAFYQMDNAVRFVAECMDMCPEYEREEREFTNFLEIFEKIPGTEQVDHSKAVKRYKRSAAGDPPPLPCDVRPPHILLKTLDYLFNTIIQTHGIVESHGFVRDRCRSIRNDLTLQNYRGKEAILLHERIARYHILCSNVLCGSEGFVLQQEVEQLRKTLQSLMEYYSEYNQHLENEAEFQAYYILTFPWNNDIVSKLEQELKSEIFLDEQVQLALQIRFMMTRKNDNNLPSEDGSLNHYARIFTLLKKSKVSYLFACCIHLHFVDIRRGALKAMQKSYQFIDNEPSSGHRLEEIIEMLGFDGIEDSTSFLAHYFIDVEDHGFLIAKIGKRVVTEFNGKKKPVLPKFPYTIIPDNIQPTKSELVERKKGNLNYIEVLYGKISHVNALTNEVNVPDVNMYVDANSLNNNHMQKSVKRPNEETAWPNINANPFMPSNVAGQVPTINHIDQKFQFTPTTFSFTKAEAAKPIPGPNSKDFIKPKVEEKPLFSFKPPINGQHTPSTLPLPKFNFSTPSFSDSLFNTPSKPTKLDKQELINPKELYSAFKQPDALSVPEPVVPTVDPIKEISLVEKFELVKGRIVNELMDEEIYKVINSTIIENSNKQRQVYLASKYIVEQLIEEEIVAVIADRAQVWKQLRGYRNGILQIVEELLADEINSNIVRVHTKHINKQQRLLSLMRFGFDRWKFFATQRYLEKQRKIIMKQKMKKYLSQSFHKPIASFAPKNHVENIVQSKLTSFAQEMESKRATWYEPFKFENDIFPQLSVVSPTRRYKLIISTSALTAKQHGTCEWFIDKWFKSKFNTDQKAYPEDAEIFTVSSNSFIFESEYLSVLTQHLHNRGTALSKMMHNSEAPLSGSNMAIFQLEYFTTLHLNIKNYLQIQWKLLHSFASKFPLHSQIPLLLVYWPNELFPLSEFSQNISQLVDGLNTLEYSPFSLCNVVCLDVSNESFDSSIASSKLKESLVWLFESASTEPVLLNDLITEYTPVVQNFEWAITKIEECIPFELIGYPQAHVICLNMMVQMYNCFLRQIVNILIDPKLLQIPFPAEEFATFPLSWNTSESFSKIDQVGLASLLQEFTFKTNDFQSGQGGVQSLYVHFVELLCQLPGANAKELDKLSEFIVNQVRVSPSSIFFQISTLTLQFFSDTINLKSKRYLPFDYRKLQFNSTCQLLLESFMKGEQYLDLLAAFATPSKKRKNEELQTPAADSVKKAHERLKQAMLSAKKLIENK